MAVPKKTLINATSDFSIHVGKVRSNLPYLPLIHITGMDKAQEILSSRQLEPQSCQHFLTHDGASEKLVYLSYGRPSYRRKNAGLTNTSPNSKPVAFIFRSDAIKGIVHRVFPFDTGGFFGKFFETWLTPPYPILDYALNNNIDSARKVVKYFFGSNEKYFKAIVKDNLANVDTLDITINQYINMIRFKGIGVADDRRLAIEVQLAQPLRITANTLMNIIVPDEAVNSQRLKMLMRGLTLAPDYYLSEGFAGCPSEWDGILRVKALELIDRS
jgi:hypothetical protein